MSIEVIGDGLVVPQSLPEGHVALIPLELELDFLAVVGALAIPLVNRIHMGMTVAG